MATNTPQWLIVVAVARLMLSGVIAGVVYRTRGTKLEEIVRDQAEEEDALHLRREEQSRQLA